MQLLLRWIDFWNRQVKKFTIFDVKLAQAAAMCSALIVAKLVPQILTVNIWWFVVLALVCAARPTYVFFSR